MRVAVNRLNKRAYFGHLESTAKINPNTGDAISEPVVDWDVYAGRYNRTMSQSIEIAGTSLKDTIVIIIRHNNQVEKVSHVKFDGEWYQIVYSSLDDSSPIAYDLITLQKWVKKHG